MTQALFTEKAGCVDADGPSGTLLAHGQIRSYVGPLDTPGIGASVQLPARARLLFRRSPFAGQPVDPSA